VVDLILSTCSQCWKISWYFRKYRKNQDFFRYFWYFRYRPIEHLHITWFWLYLLLCCYCHC